MSAAAKLTSQNVDIQSSLLGIEKSVTKLEENEEKVDCSKISMKFYYWRIKNRGNFVRFALEYAGIKYDDIIEGKIVKTKCICRGAMEKHDRRFDPFAPPLIEHNGYIFSQTVPIQQYIAELSGLRPKTALDNALCAMILENTNDLMIEMYKYTEDDGSKLLEFLNGRFQIWLNVLERPLTHGTNNDNNARKYYFENRVTVADTSVGALMDGFHELFTTKYDTFIGKTHPQLEKLHQTIVNHDGIQKLLQRQAKEGLQFFYDSRFKNMKQVILTLDGAGRSQNDAVETEKVVT